jgi:hypothetical protein
MEMGVALDSAQPAVDPPQATRTPARPSPLHSQATASCRDGCARPSGGGHAVRSDSLAGLLARAVAARATTDADPHEPAEAAEPLRDVPPAIADGPQISRMSDRRLQRLTVTEHSFKEGKCGARRVEWIFSLDKPAPEDGYIVQQIDTTQSVATCPTVASATTVAVSPFWEAWLVKKGDKVDWTTTRDVWTDGSERSAQPSTNGQLDDFGTIKFFAKSVTGDLGDFGKKSGDGSSDWSPGKEPQSGGLPSTRTKPKWWDGTPVEGPAFRSAKAVWNCCSSKASEHTNVVTRIPAPGVPTPPKSGSTWYLPWTWFD